MLVTRDGASAGSSSSSREPGTCFGHSAAWISSEEQDDPVTSLVPVCRIQVLITA
jgi:hypothetical protein